MNHAFLVLLSNLLQLHTHLDPSSPSLLSPSSSDSLLLSPSSAAPLFFFTIAAVLASIAAAAAHPPPSSDHQPVAISSASATATAADYGVSAFKALVTERIWGMEAPLRDAHWRACYGISYPLFTTVLEKLRPHIAASGLSLPSDYALALALSRLSLGLSAAAAAAAHSLDPFLVSKITNLVTRLLSTKLYREYIQIPVGRRRLSAAVHGFHLLTSLPNMCGAIATTAVPLRRRPAAPVLLQVVSDHRRLFWDVCAAAHGGAPSENLRRSNLYRRLTTGDVVWEKAVSVSGHGVRPYFVGGRGFPLLGFLLTPFGEGGGRAEEVFDGGLRKGRRVVGDAIGLLKGRWRMLKEVNVGVGHAAQTIVACCVLHNLCQIASEPEPEGWKEEDEEEEDDDLRSRPRFLECEMASYYAGETSRRALADDMVQRFP